MIRPRLQAVAPRIKPAALSAERRTRGRAWQDIRRRILTRDCGLCQECKRQGRVGLADEVDHVIELQDGGTDADANLEALCHEHHAEKTARSQAARRGQG